MPITENIQIFGNERATKLGVNMKPPAKKKPITWKDYAKARPENKYPDPILYPVEIDLFDKVVSQTTISERGKPVTNKRNFFQFRKDRMRTTELVQIWQDVLDSVALSETQAMETILEDYFNFFKGNDGNNIKPPAGPLDFKLVDRPVIFLFYLNVGNWSFSGHKQFDCPNIDPHSNIVRQISTFDNRNGILVYRGEDDTWQTSPDNPFKYDFYVTVYQEDGTATDIIIDPRDRPRPP